MRGCAALGAATLLTGCAKSEAPAAAEAEQPSKASAILKIGVSLPSASSHEGRLALDVVSQASKALGVEFAVIEHANDSERVQASIKTLASVGCAGVIAHVASERQVDAAIAMADQEGVYLAQFGSATARAAFESQRVVGAAHADGLSAGAELVSAQLVRGGPAGTGARRLAVIAAQDDLFVTQALKGFSVRASEWNQLHPDDQVSVGDASYVGASYDGGYAAVGLLAVGEQLPDGILVVGSDDMLAGALEGMRDHNMAPHAKIATTSLCADMASAWADDLLLSAIGGAYWEALFAFVLAYRACTGKQTVEAGEAWQDVVCPAPTIMDEDAYEAYEAQYLNKTALTDSQIKELAGKGTDELNEQAAALVEDRQ